MKQSIRWLITSVLLAALLPVTAWGNGFYDTPGDRYYPSYAGSTGGHQYSGSLRLQTGMTEDGYFVRANIEGLRPEDVQIYIRRNRLVVQVDQGGQYSQPNPGIRNTSQWRMSFRKQLRLPYDSDWTRMTTSTANGIMEIHIPRRSPYVPINPILNR